MSEMSERIWAGREIATGSTRAAKVASHPPQAGRRRQGAQGLV